MCAPLFLSQALVVAMYVFGFREGWNWQFPTHPPLLVDLWVFVVILTLADVSANLSFRIQYLIMAVTGVSLISIFGDLKVWQSSRPIQWFRTCPGALEEEFPETHFWAVFAVFFPAIPQPGSWSWSLPKPWHGHLHPAWIMGPPRRDLASMAQLVQMTRSTCLFVCDSGEESALS